MHTSAKLLVAALPFSLMACNGQAPEETSTHTTAAGVSTLTLSVQETKISERFVGKTRAVEQVAIVPKVSGYITARLFEEGEKVTKGDVLYQIDPAPYQVEVDRLNAMVEQAEAQYQICDKTWQKARKLAAQNALTQIELEQIEAERKQLSAQLKAAQADLERARLELSYTSITAPFDGIAGVSNVSPGSLVGPQSAPLTQLVSYRNMYVNIQLNEKEFLNDLQDKMQRGVTIEQPDIRLQLANGADYRQKGEVNFIDNQVDGSNGTITFRVKFPNPDALLVPGQFVTLISTSSGEQKIVIPQQTVQEDQSGRFVMVVNDKHQAEARYLTLGQRIGQNWIVESGLSEGDQLIVKGMQQARPGQPVTIVNQG